MIATNLALLAASSMSVLSFSNLKIKKHKKRLAFSEINNNFFKGVEKQGNVHKGC